MFSLAAETYQQALSLCDGRVPEKKMALCGLGDALVGSGKYIEARTIADDLIVIGEQLGYKIRAGALFGMKEYSLAETDCRRFLGFEPSNKDSLKLLGNICIILGKDQEAKKYFKASY